MPWNLIHLILIAFLDIPNNFKLIFCTLLCFYFLRTFILTTALGFNSFLSPFPLAHVKLLQFSIFLSFSFSEITLTTMLSYQIPSKMIFSILATLLAIASLITLVVLIHPGILCRPNSPFWDFPVGLFHRPIRYCRPNSPGPNQTYGLLLFSFSKKEEVTPTAFLIFSFRKDKILLLVKSIPFRKTWSKTQKTCTSYVRERGYLPILHPFQTSF